MRGGNGGKRWTRSDNRCTTCGCPRRPWLTPKEVAAALPWSARKVRRMLQLGLLPGRKIGTWLVSHQGLDRLMNAGGPKKDNAHD